MNAKEGGAQGRSSFGVPLTDRVNSAPPIFNGMSETEASYLGVAGLIMSACMGGLIASVTGHFLIMAVICIIGTLVTLWYGSLYLQKIKRGKPEGCYLQAARIYLAQRGFMKKCYLAHDGYFDLGRRMEY